MIEADDCAWDISAKEHKKVFGKAENGIVYAVQTHYLEHMIPDIVDTDELAGKYVMFCADWQIRGIFSTRKEAQLYADEYAKIPFLTANVHAFALNDPTSDINGYYNKQPDLADLFEIRHKLQEVLAKARKKQGIKVKGSFEEKKQKLWELRNEELNQAYKELAFLKLDAEND